MTEPLASTLEASFENNKDVDSQNEESAGVPTPPLERKKESLDLHRKVLPKLETEDQNVCAICLDEYTSEDPAQPTCCGHAYHLQCIMQWAQRSKECPLCFHTLQLQDETMNSLLPFGEYVDPRQEATTTAMLESWELERFLVRLATAERRSARQQSRQRRATHSGAETSSSLPQAIPTRSAARATERGVSSSSSTATVSVGGSAGGVPYPASWPPRGNETVTRTESGGSDVGMSPMQSLKSRLASLRVSTTRELKSLFGSPAAPRQQQQQ